MSLANASQGGNMVIDGGVPAGRLPSRRSLLATLSVVACLGAWPGAQAQTAGKPAPAQAQAPSQAWSVEQLMQLLAQTRASRARFEEKKYLSALDEPLESSGELIYQAPDRLEKRTTAPHAESLVLDKDMLVFERQGRKRSIPVQAYPEVGAFVESIRATLAGDQQALARYYKMVLKGHSGRWTLSLQPLQAKAAALVSQVSVTGQRERIDAIEILQRNGDRSVMSIMPVAAAVASAAR